MGLGAVVMAYEVVLATCNGVVYLDQQILSILEQTLPPARILVADDGSTDGTFQCLQSWQQRSSVPIELLFSSSVGRLGSCRNFERLLKATTLPYVMLADQDDIWDSDKAARLLSRMNQLEQQRGSSQPLLVHADLRLIDEFGQVLAASFHCYQGLVAARESLLAIGLQNVVTGCACVINRACLQKALPFPAEVVLHDWWLALVASRFAGLSYLPEPCLSYRQHHSNVVGAVGWRRQLHTRLAQVVAAKGIGVFSGLISPGLSQLRECVRRFGPAELALRLEPVWNRSSWIRLRSALRLGLRKHGVWRTAGFYAALLLARPSEL